MANAAASKAGVQLVKTFKLTVAKGPDLLDLCAAPAPAKVAAKPINQKAEPEKPVQTKPTAATKPVAPKPATAKPTATPSTIKPVKPLSKQPSEYPGLSGDIQGDEIASSIRDRVTATGTINEKIAEAEAKKQKINYPKPFKLAAKAGNDTIDIAITP